MPRPTGNATESTAPDDPQRTPAGPKPSANRWWLVIGMLLAALLAVWRCG